MPSSAAAQAIGRDGTPGTRGGIYCDARSEWARRAFLDEGLRLVEREAEAELLWIRKGFLGRLGKLRPHQLINHLPNESAIINKVRLTEALHRLSATDRGDTPPAQAFYQESYCLHEPAERARLIARLAAADERDSLWICKPGTGSRGRGVRILRGDALRAECEALGERRVEDRDAQAIAQRYIRNPLLLDGRKSEIRVYWLLASVDPLLVLLYPEGTVRLNTLPYRLDDFGNPLIHITNVYQQKRHPDYDPNAVLKWSFDALAHYLHVDRGVAGPEFMHEVLPGRIRRCLATVVRAAYDQLRRGYPRQGDCFGLYGADLILDDRLELWLTEIQKGPGLSFDDPVKANVIPAMLGEAARIMLELRERRRAGAALDQLASRQRYQWVIRENVT